MVAYTRDEIVSISDLSRGLSTILNSIIDRSKPKLAISKNNKLEAVMLSIDEYEKLKLAYDTLEQQEIESILNSRSDEEKQISHSKIVALDI
ncbi:MAG: type II toxin-antitoxin system Phd/YefM family antitoxin [Sulfuricurvum sp.]|jgi:PHD/YefM family antitoxin component YafN of YafNO toxin-antitoxin module